MAIPQKPYRPTVAVAAARGQHHLTPSDGPPTAPMPLLALSYRQAADALGVSERTVWQLVRDGQLRAARIGRCVRIAVAELQRYLAEKTARGGADNRERPEVS